ncbi:hypothetical protein CSKR_114538 [Clonorchis sinensis]|uniref:Uncharacterized protein n=1 Tax=Clonorchis sinensis TaxID=79923 RepID=A0A8T1LY52_CLOSI|nr:hypothetical protein CSKR_114538 [Clonorchis sinensis]
MLQTTLSGAFLASVHTLHSFVIIEKTQVSALLFWEHAFSIVVGIQCKPNATRNEEFSSLTGMDVLVPGFCPCLILFSPMEVVHTSTEGLLFVLRVQEGTHLKFELAVDWMNGLLPDACLIDVVIATRQFLTTDVL